MDQFPGQNNANQSLIISLVCTRQLSCFDSKKDRELGAEKGD